MSRLRKPDTIILEIQLRSAVIPVWRIIEIPLKSTLHQLHLYIQVAMGWTCSHLYEFRDGDIYYRYVFPEEPVEYPEDMVVENSELISLQELNLQPGKRISYEYDFGDSWMHDVYVKGFSIKQATVLNSPCCSAGAMACPPENSGGIHAYNELVQFRLHKTPIRINPELEKYFRNFDIYKVDSVRSFGFESRVKSLRRAYD
jgi:hypothetical protein